MLKIFAIAGGIFVILVFIHFFADWVLQSNEIASNKHDDFPSLGRHCLFYTAVFVPVILFLGIGGWYLPISILLLYISHFVIDTCVPVYLWVRFIRRVPELSETTGTFKERYLRSKQAFDKLFIESPMNAILLVVVDQILHLSFLWIIVVFALV